MVARAVAPGDRGSAPARKVNSHNEWDRLQEIIVGTAEGTVATLEWGKPGPIRSDVQTRAMELVQKANPRWYLDEIAEDLEALCDVLRRNGVMVHRPTVHDLSAVCSSPFWTSNGNNAYNVRDLELVVGNTVIDSPSPLRSRYFEATMLYPIWYDYLPHGFRWISAPRPRLDHEPFTPYFRDDEERVLTDEDIKHRELAGGRLEQLHRLTEREILFEAANTLRMGRDLLYLVSVSGNVLGAQWLQSVLGSEYRVHTTDEIYRSSHIDSTVLCLRPGLVVLNSTRVGPETCPKIFDKWDKIYFDDVAPTPSEELDFQRDVRAPPAAELKALGFTTNLSEMSSPWIGMNFLSVDPETVIVDMRQTNLIRTLEGRGFTVIPIRMRHMYTQQGGIHCTTLDTVREGGLESYFD